MYTVYKITNLKNNKCYIGSSIRVEKRWKQHKSTAFNKNSDKYDYPLYRAFRKYGLENFSFEIIKDDFSSIEEMQNFEQEMIIFYNSLNYGYNQTLNTITKSIAKENCSNYSKKISCKCAKIDKNNNILEIYQSYHEAARKNGLDGENYATKIRNICKGKTSSFQNDLIFRDLDENNNIIEQPFKHYNGKKPLIGINLNTEEEIYFSSVSEAASILNLDRQSIGKCIQGNSRYTKVGGYIFRELDLDGNIIEINPSISEVIEQYNKSNPLINGERHTTTEWCKIFNISKYSYYQRLKKGMGVIEALTTPKRR